MPANTVFLGQSLMDPVALCAWTEHIHHSTTCYSGRPFDHRLHIQNRRVKTWNFPDELCSLGVEWRWFEIEFESRRVFFILSWIFWSPYFSCHRAISTSMHWLFFVFPRQGVACKGCQPVLQSWNETQTFCWWKINFVWCQIYYIYMYVYVCIYVSADNY